MSEFEYLTGLLTIVLGLAIARTMGGIALFLSSKKRTLYRWTLLGFCLALAAMQIDWWRVLWITLGDSDLLAETVYLWITATALLYLASYLLVPGGESTELDESTIRPAFYACMAIHFCAFPLYRLIQGQAEAIEAGTVVMIGLCLCGMVFRRGRVQFAFALLWFLLAFGSIILSFGSPFI